MFHMLSCFNLKPGLTIEQFRQGLEAFSAHMKELDLLETTGPIGLRQSNTIMDTDEERDHQYFFTMSFRDRRQCDQSVEFIYSEQEPGATRHHGVYSMVEDPVFICWQDID